MTFEPFGFDPFGDRPRAVDNFAAERAERLRELGFGQRPEPLLDEFARELALAADAPNAMVNLIGEEQYVGGLYSVGAAGDDPAVSAAARGPAGLDLGFCPHVVVRRKALVLDDVCEYPRFAGNLIVDKMGVRTYLGAPLIHRSGTVLGTACVVDAEPRSWGQDGLHLIKEQAARLMDLIHQREQALGGLHSR